ncbi:hypothetical protein QFZ80_004864 [Paenibacillus sp. V4I7]|nr:hypothetical protein [Paenibacillus sp. V4I7]MDQ0920461.1 hypothetical protein [Paenibacillus sp. V4I5]
MVFRSKVCSEVEGYIAQITTFIPMPTPMYKSEWASVYLCSLYAETSPRLTPSAKVYTMFSNKVFYLKHYLDRHSSMSYYKNTEVMK